jgi:pimeloyl-ACP methyl ester carboxylesterase
MLCHWGERMKTPSHPARSNKTVLEWSVDQSWNPWAYWTDACQRWVLFWDVLRQRSERYQEHAAKTAPHVLKFTHELVMDGRGLSRPVNYGLVRVLPPDGAEIDPRKRPFVIVDPRAGHGPGIGGFKADSEVGVAFKAGHPCYFIGFLPEPVPGQSIEDIAHAEAAFLERVIALHPEAEGKPAVVGNCQAGWAVMLLAATRPELFGPIILAGSPLSYWAGVRGQNPMRYTGGLLGGSWLTALTGDLGKGKFDGAWLVANFENLNPANTFWTKQYNLYAKVDTEPPRYLEFEQYWGGYVFLNAEEMQFIVDQLFVGNKLATSEIVSSDGLRIDLRNIGSPIVVFCSRGDNITPPPQALNWILDLYRSVDDIRVHGQTIVYAVHESAGHLGIFVSGSVAKKEHDEFASNIDLIDVLPPGLYEAVMLPKDAETTSADLIGGNYLVRFEPRTLDDVRALGGNDEEDDRKFAAVARVSEINLGLYRTFVQPWVQGWANEGFAKWMRQLHPLRLPYESLSPVNPFMRPLQSWAEEIQKNRQPVSKDNAFWQAQEELSDWFRTSLDGYRDVRDHTCEALFHVVYGSPLVQAMVGLKASDHSPRRRPGDEPVHKAFVAQRVQELTSAIAEGGPREAALRALLYVRQPEGAVDERGFNLLRRMRDEAGGLTLAEFKELVREQFFMLLLDQRRAVNAIPAMLARDPKSASRMAGMLHRVIDAVGLRTELERARLAEVERFFEPERLIQPPPLEVETSRLARGRQPSSQPATTSKH